MLNSPHGKKGGEVKEYGQSMFLLGERREEMKRLGYG